MKPSLIRFKKQFPVQKAVFIVLVFLVLLLGSFTQLFGQNNTWDGSSSNNWNTAANWSLNAVPTAAHDIVINIDAAISVDANATINSLNINNSATVSFTSSGGGRTITIDNTGSSVSFGSRLTLQGSTGTGTRSMSIIYSGTNRTMSIAGTLILTAVGDGTIYNATNSLTTVTGTFINDGTGGGTDGVITSSTGNLTFSSGGIYEHALDGGTIPTAIWNVASTCNITGVVGTVPTVASFYQSFGNFTWNCTNQNSNLSMAAALATENGGSITGNFQVNNTGSGSLRLVNGMGDNRNINISGNFIFTGGTLYVVGDATGYTGTYSMNVNILGYFLQTGGNLDLSGNNQSGIFNIAGDFTLSSGTMTESGSSTNRGIVFSGSSMQIFTSSGTVSNTINFTINNGAYLQLAAEATTVTGGGSFTLASGGKLGVTSDNGITTTGTASGNIRVTGTRTYNTGATYIYNGSTNQVTGTGLPATVYGLTINNSSGVSLTSPTIVSGTLSLSNGILTSSTTNTLSVTNTSTTAITGGTSSIFINGPLIWTLAPGSTYIFPVGKGTTYLPFGLTGITGIAPQIRAEGFTGSTGGTATSPLGSLSTTEYWLASVTSGTYTTGSVSLTRQTALAGLDAIGRSATINGAYTSLDGTVSGTSIINSDVTGNSLGYFVMAAKASVTTGSISPTTYCAGASVSVPFTITGTFTLGNIFTAQLSDATGDFGSPVYIGSITQTTAGTIPATIPSGTTSGTGYKIRVVSNTPVVNGSDNGSNLTVNPLPVAAGTITGTATVCPGAASVAYSVPVNTNASSYTWAYSGTGTTITGTTNNVTVTFAANATAGNLTVYGTNACGNGTISANYAIIVNSLPVAAGTITGAATVCQGAPSEAYTVPDITNATSYMWAYSGTGATIIGTTNSVTITFAANATAGNLTVYGVNTCGNGTISANYAITVNPLPDAAGTITGTATVCQEQNAVAYSVPAITNATSYTWAYSGTGATVSGSTASMTINFSASATSGNLTVRGTNACGSGTVSANYAITVNPLPVAAGTITGTATVCPGAASVAYSVQVIMNATSYTWAYSGTGATITGTTNSVTITFAANATAGNLTVYGTNACGSGTVSANYAITVNPLPVAAGTITGAATVCQGAASEAYNVPAITNATSYTWAYSGTGATITGTTNSVTITFAANATAGNLTVYGVNTCGNGTISANYAITVNPLPDAAGTITGTATVCQGQNDVAYSVPAITNATSYTWTYSGTGATVSGSIASMTINFSASATSGNLTVRGTNACGNGTVSANYSITVYSAPAAPTANAGSGAACTQITANWTASTNATSYTLDVSTVIGFGSYVTGYQDLNVENVTAYAVTGLTAGITYYYRVRAVSSCGTSVSSGTITYATTNLPEQPSVISGSTTPCQGSSQTYSVTNVSGVTYAWILPSGWTGSSTTNSITVTVGAAGGNIQVTPSDVCGTGTAQTLAVTVSTVPAQPSDILGNTTPCQGSLQTYSVTNVGGTTYTWVFPAGWTQTGGGTTYSVTVTVGTNSGDITVTPGNTCGNGTARTLAVAPTTVSAQPGAITGSTTPCQTSTQTYNVSNVGGVTYNWSFPSGWSQTGGGTSNSVTVAVGSGSGDITVTPGNNCGSGTARTLPVTPGAAPSTTGITICQGGSGSLTSTACVGSTSTSLINAGAGANITGIGTIGWNNPGNITTAGTPYATVALNQNIISNYLRGTGYGFAIPTGATITGITVVINRQSDGTITPLIRDNRVSLLKAGVVQTTNYAATTTNWTNGGGFGTATYGGQTDLWGTTWTVADINSTNFGVVLSAINNNTNYARMATVDYMQIAVTYSTGTLYWYIVSSGGTSIGSGSPFNPVGVAGSGLVNTNTPGTYTYYAECSTGTGCRAATDFVINETPSAPIVGTITQPTCATATGSVDLSGLPVGTWTLTALPGGATQTGSGTSATFTGLTANTTYTFTVTPSGCTSVASGNAVINAQPIIPGAPSIGTITQPTCATATGSVALSGLPAGAWTLIASPGGATQPGSGTTATFTGLTAGTTYTFTVTVTSSGCTSAASGNAVINAQPTNGTWLGITSIDWNTATNWCGGVPTASTDVLIPSAPTNQPNISAAAFCNNITINAGASLTITNTNSLTVNGNWTNDGNFYRATSTINFSGSSTQTISGTTAIPFYNVILSNSSAAISANTNFSVTGTLTVNSAAILSPAPNVIISGAAGTLTGNGTVLATRTTTGTPDFNSQYTISNKTLTNLTVDYAGTGAQTVNAINYGNLTISPDGTRTVTFANGTIGVAGIFSPAATNTTYVVTGSTVNFNGSGAQTINAFNYNNLTISNAGIKQLGGAVAANLNVTINSGTTLDVTAANFSLSVGGNWINNGGTFSFVGGTVTFNGTTAQAIQGTATSQFFYNLIINKTVGTIITFPGGGTTTISMNNLTVNQGTLRINDASTTKRTINVNGNLMVQSAGSITTGTGNTIGSYTLPTNFPSGQYFSIFHELNITGNFTNDGSVRFTNLSAPNYGAFATNGAVTVRFIGYSDNTVTLNGLTDFYNLIVDKGSDKTYLLTLSSSNTANFSLYGPALLGRNELSPFTPDNPEVRKALWIKNGTLKLTGNILIPTLSEGDNANGNGDYAIGGNAQLWIAGPSVTIYTTATTATGFPQAPAGSLGVLAGSSYQALSVYGTFRISDGFFGTRNSAGFIFWDTPNATAEVIFEGGLVNTSVFREGMAPGRASYLQTGGTVIVRGNETEPGEMSGFPVFGITNPSSSFVMSGGNLIIQDSDSGTPVGGNGFNVGVDPGNFLVNGGTVTFETNPANTSSIDVFTTANFWNLELKRLPSTSGTSTVNLLSNLVVANNLTIFGNANLSAGTGNFPVTVSRTFTINNGGTYAPGTNTTTFTGGGNYYFWNDGTITNGLYNLTANKTAGTLIMAGTATDFTVRNDLTIARDTLADGGKNIYVSGNIINNGTHQGAGKISLNKTNGSQTISGNGTGKFRNLELNNTNGTSGSAQVSLSANISVTGNLILANNRIFDISSYQLTIDKLGDITGSLGSLCFIRTSGAVSNGGLRKIFNDTIAFTYPVGSGTNYTPATVHVNKIPGTYGSVTIKPVNSRHPLVLDQNCFNYYWKVEESGFTGIVPGSVKMTFNYGNLPDNTAYVPGKYYPPDWTYINDVTLVDETTKLIKFNGVNSFAGDYTAGIPGAFGASITYYSRANGNWDSPSTWSTIGFGGAEAISIPGANSLVNIGDGGTYNHTITVTAGAVSGSLSLKQGSFLDISSTSGNNFGTVISGSNGTLRISANGATAIFPAGDFGTFLGATGGTVEYYTTGSQNFVLPVTTAAPSSMSIANYYNLQITPATGRQITMPDANLVVFGNMTVQGASTTGLAGLNSVSARNLTIKNNLNVTSGNLLFQNAYAQTLTVEKDVIVSSGAIFNVLNSGTGVNNSLSIGGNLTNNGTFDMSIGNGLCAVTFTGNSDAAISGSGSTTDFYSININKGISSIPVLNVTSSAFSLSSSTAPLTLINGTFRLTSPLSVNISAMGFSIPATACLSANGGTLLIATAADNNADIDLAGKLEIKAGSISIGTSTNVINNDIVYAGTGSPTIDIQGGTLFVNGQIRRILTNGLGSLIYKQSGSSSVTINGQNSQATRAKLEVLNPGSVFEMSPSSTLTIVRGGGASFNDLYLAPTSSNVTGGTVIFGNGSTETVNQNFSMNVVVPLNNLTVDGTTTSKTVNLSGNSLTLLGSLTINATSVFNCNGLNLTVGGDFTNSNIDANTGISTGGYRPGSLSQVTTFNGSTTNQIITGTSANLTNFAKLIVNNTYPFGTVSLASNSAIRVNSDLTLTQGTLADGNNVITVLGNISNSATHSGTGQIVLGGSGVQILSGNGTGKFDNLRLNGVYNVQMTASQEITGVLTFNTKMLDIGSNLLKLSNTSSGATAGSTATSYIRLSGLVMDLGVQKSYPATPLDFTFPIGVVGKYTPARISITSNSAIGTITIVPVNSKHPGTTNPLDKQLNYYWSVKKTGFSGLTATHVYTYVPADVSGNENFYDAARFYLSNWDYGSTTTISVPNHTANFTAVNYVDGDFTAGEISEFGSIMIYYSRNFTSGGNWDDVNTWSTVSHDGMAAISFPIGQPVIIASGHTVTANGSFRNAYSIVLSGTLDLAGYTGHDFGTVISTGTIKLTPSGSGNFVFPAGDYTTFTSAGGGTIELNNSSGTAIFPSITTYNNLLLSGTGTKQMINSDITLNGNITNSSGSIFIASSVNKLILYGNWVNNGTYNHNSGSIDFNGNTTISGSSNTTFNNLAILAGKTLIGIASSGFDVAGNWVNNGTFTHNSGTVNFSGSTIISGSSVTTFNNISISSLKMLTGKYNDQIIVQGNWINNGNFIKNGGTVSFDGTSSISGSSVTTFHNLVINSSRSLTAPLSGTVNISQDYTNNGTFIPNNGKLAFNGSSQAIRGTAQTQFNDLEIVNGSITSISTPGQSISGTLLCNGTINTNANLTLLSTSVKTALIDGSGTGDVTGNVTMQRYLPSGFGYKYFSSPFQNATVGQFSGPVNLSAPFPTFYRYDENRLSAGWINYTNPLGRLEPMWGYAVNFGSAPAAVTISISGVVNNKTLSPLTLINNSKPYTAGFNLIGNPYPSPIDWDAATGWTKTNIDNAVYFFNASNPGGDNDTTQYTGIYSSYVNGISNGNASNIIAAMQGFFVHVSTIHPIDATLIFNNGIRRNNLDPVFKSVKYDPRPLLRLSAGFSDYGMQSDPVVIYFDDLATQSFDANLDALKLMNTDVSIPNLYVLSPDASRLSISGMPYPVDSITKVSLGLKTAMDGWITFNILDLKQMPLDLHVYLEDAVAHIYQDLKLNPKYRTFLRVGGYENRFSLVFSQSEWIIPPVVVASEKFTLTREGGILMVNLNLSDNEKGVLQMINMHGQVLFRHEAFGNESIALNSRLSSGIYVISLISGNKQYSKKIIIPNQ